MSKNKLKDALAESLGDLPDDSASTARAIVNRGVRPQVDKDAKAGAAKTGNEKAASTGTGTGTGVNGKAEDNKKKTSGGDQKGSDKKKNGTEAGEAASEKNDSSKVSTGTGTGTGMNPAGAGALPGGSAGGGQPLPSFDLGKPKAKFNDTHESATVVIRSDVLAKINELAQRGGRGWKTRFINEALLSHLAAYGIKLPGN